MSGSFLINSARNVVRLTGERIFTSTNFNPISWTVPAGVTSISIVVVGGGGVSINFTLGQYGTGSAGGGGGLAWVTDIAVTPGEILEINVGFGGGGGSNFVTGAALGTNIGTISTDGVAGGSSWVRRQGSGTFIVLATGGGAGIRASGSLSILGGAGGLPQIGESGGTGGTGGFGSGTAVGITKSGAGGGGAGGYSGKGGDGANSFASPISLQQGAGGQFGGGAGGTNAAYAGAFQTQVAADGGSVGIYGQRLDGFPASIPVVNGLISSGPGSTINTSAGAANNQYIYAGGGGGAFSVSNGTGLISFNANQGQRGAVRIIWPGAIRRFPDLNVGPDYRGLDSPIGELSVTVDGPTTLTANWTNPTNFTGSPILSWTIRFSVLAAGTPPGTSSTAASTVEVTLPDTGTPITSYTTSTFVQGRSYNVEVRTTNSFGSGGWSNNVVIAPAVAPSAPFIGTATNVNSTTASVSYTAPTDGGSVITSYTAVSSPGGITGTVLASGSGSITVTGLTDLQTYTFTVFATNAVGNSVSSSASNSVTVQNPPQLYAFTSATFTPGGATFRTGPSLTQARTGLTGSGVDAWKNNTSFFNTDNGIQIWTVPATGTYQIDCYGAQGGDGGVGSTGAAGRGARMSSPFNLTEGEIIRLVVGQQGWTQTNGWGGGTGGGGSFVWRPSFTTFPMIAAGAGGGGGIGDTFQAGGQIGTSGGSGGHTTPGAGGTGGNASLSSGVCGGGGGQGWNGGASNHCGGAFTWPALYVNPTGFTSGSHDANGGGFGGGGGSYGGSGGGGGYSGGGSGGWSQAGRGGGGGSFSSVGGVGSITTAATRPGQGQIIITRL
jgi:hypothetical protein